MSETTAPSAQGWGPWLAMPLVSGCAFVAIYFAAVLTTRGQAIEDQALAGAAPAGQLPFVLSLVTVPALLLAAGVLLVLAAIRRRWDRVLQAALTIGISNVAAQALKYVILGRPPLGGPSDENTFPSGHTTVYVSVFMTLVIVVPVAYAGIAALIGAALSSWAVLELLGYGYHRLSDVLGGILLVVTVLSASMILTGRLRPDRPPGRRHALAADVTPTLAVGVLVAGYAVYEVFVAGLLSRDRLLLAGTEVVAAVAMSVAFLIAVGLARRFADDRADLYYDGRGDESAFRGR